MSKVRGKSFHFKQFTVEHDKCAMKVNTDAVVLGAYVANMCVKELIFGDKALDIGTGTGIVSLMLAQKLNHEIDAVELNAEACSQAKENFENSTWKNKLRAIETCFIGFAIHKPEQSYDLIVSNPPFFSPQIFHENNHQQVPEINRKQARYDDFLPFVELIKGAFKLLTLEGVFFVIIPYKRAVEFTAIAVEQGFYIQSQLDIISVDKKAPKRVILRLRKFSTAFQRSELILHTDLGIRTPEFLELTNDYYINVEREHIKFT
jgi:tRNA1Val (adenine37-N6)-methyltransferase